MNTRPNDAEHKRLRESVWNQLVSFVGNPTDEQIAAFKSSAGGQFLLHRDAGTA